MGQACAANAPTEKNPGAVLGALMGALAQEGRDKITFVISREVESFGDWVEQLIAESTGKEGKGILPVVGEPLGSPKVYGEDRIFVQLRLGEDDENAEALEALAAAGHPVLRLQLTDKYDLGSQFFMWELATAVASFYLKVNPFDQPNVESAKDLAKNKVESYKITRTLPERESAHLSAEALAGFLGNPASGAYVALQAYVNPTPEAEAILQAIRLKLRDTYKTATTLGFGPRFLHSTGQLHKGDAGNGLFIQITSENGIDLPIPDEAGSEPSSMSFQTLKISQALGDAEALQAAGRRVIRFHVEDIKVLDRLSI
jgi:hypothetical protein